MSLAPKPKRIARPSIFSDRGAGTAKLSLIQAVYFDRTQTAEKIIATDPEQINLQDPFAGLTSLHIAVFRQNAHIVEILARHPATQIGLKDRFGRTAMDMCVYTRNEKIFEAVLSRTYQAALLPLDGGDDTVVPFKPG